MLRPWMIILVLLATAACVSAPTATTWAVSGTPKPNVPTKGATPTFPDAFAMNQCLGRGVNLGNAL